MCRHRISAVRLPSFLNARKKEGAPQHALITLVISFPTCLGRRFELPPFLYGEGVPLESPSGFGCIEQPPPARFSNRLRYSASMASTLRCASK